MRVPDLEDIVDEAEREASSLKSLVEQWYDVNGRLIEEMPIPVVPLPKVTYPVPLNPQTHPIPAGGTANWIIQYTDSSNRLKAPSLDAPVVTLTSPTSATVYLT